MSLVQIAEILRAGRENYPAHCHRLVHVIPDANFLFSHTTFCSAVVRELVARRLRSSDNAQLRTRLREVWKIDLFSAYCGVLYEPIALRELAQGWRNRLFDIINLRTGDKSRRTLQSLVDFGGAVICGSAEPIGAATASSSAVGAGVGVEAVSVSAVSDDIPKAAEVGFGLGSPSARVMAGQRTLESRKGKRRRVAEESALFELKLQPLFDESVRDAFALDRNFFHDVSELASLPAGTFVEPIAPNCAAADAALTPNVLLNPTVGPVHPISLRGVRDFQKYMRGSQKRLSLVFVVPEDVFPSFGLQPLLTSECLHVHVGSQTVGFAHSTRPSAGLGVERGGSDEEDTDVDEETDAELEEQSEAPDAAAVDMDVDFVDSEPSALKVGAAPHSVASPASLTSLVEVKNASSLAPPSDFKRPFAGLWFCIEVSGRSVHAAHAEVITQVSLSRKRVDHQRK